MRSYLGDIIFIVLAVLTAFLLAGAPEIVRTPATRPAQPDTVAATPEIKSKDGLTESRHPYDIKAVEKRNIFAPSGSYQDDATISAPDNPYALIGVVGEGETLKAIFREYTGKVIKVSAGQRMMDGFRVVEVGKTQIVLKRGNEKKTFNLYSSPGLPVAVGGRVMNHKEKRPALIAVFEGADKKAVFRNFDGSLSVLRKGQSLPDGSVIKHIDSRLVTVADGKAEKELTLETKTAEQKREEVAYAGRAAAKNQFAGRADAERRRPTASQKRHQRVMKESGQ